MIRPARRWKPAPGTVLGGLALVVATSGVAVAAIPSNNGAVTACISNKGAVKIIDAEKGDTCGNQTTVRLASVDAVGKVRNADTLDGKDATAFQDANATAGGDLGGTYPSPSIRGGVITSSHVADWSLRMRDIATDGMNTGVNLGPMAAGDCAVIQTGDAKSDTYFTWPIAPVGWPDELSLEPMISARNAAGQFERQFRVCNRSSSSVDPPDTSFWAFLFDY